MNPSTEQVREALKPCPFCGGQNIFIDEHYGASRNGMNVYSMCCYDCGATFPNRYKRELLVEAWNRRALSQQAAEPLAPSLKRFHPFVDGSKFCGMREYHAGEYVRHSDVAAVQQPVSSAQGERELTDNMVFAAARALSDENAETCNVNKEDNWRFYSADFIPVARLALNAALLAKKEQP